MRTLFAVGHIKPKPKTLARMCSWCGRWFSDRDRIAAMNGATITHIRCRRCDDHQTPRGAA